MPPTIIFKRPPNLNGSPTIILFQGDPGPFNLMFANQFKRITRVKLRVFIPKLGGNWGPHLTFYERNAITRDGFNIWRSAMGPRSDKTCFDLHLYLAEKYCKNLKMPGAQLNINPAWAITWFVGVAIYYTFFNNNSPPPRQFLCNKILLKKISSGKGNAYWSNFWIERAWSPWPLLL